MYLEQILARQLRAPRSRPLSPTEFKSRHQNLEAELKSDAEKSVKKIEGVQNVVNNIEVLPLSPMDDQIRRAVYRAVYIQPGLEMYSLRAVPTIHIIVKNGHVTLTGAVANPGDKQRAGIAANGVSGVFSVTNDLLVSP